jgi:hypothetical protein
MIDTPIIVSLQYLRFPPYDLQHYCEHRFCRSIRKHIQLLEANEQLRTRSPKSRCYWNMYLLFFDVMTDILYAIDCNILYI